MINDELLSQLEDTFVTRVLKLGVLVVLGCTPRAANTSVYAVLGLRRRSNQLTLRLPEASTLRNAGRKCNVPIPVSLLSLTGADWTAVRVPRSKLWSRISPKGFVRASFHTTLTVPCASLTAMRGKSLGGKRL